MHPPKIQTFDVQSGVNVDNKGFRREVTEYRRTPFGLYMSRAIVDRASASWIESWLLPDLGIVVSDWTWKPGHERDQDFYLDIALVEPGDQVWRTTDLYLDVIVKTGAWTEVLDVDEFVEAVAAGLVDTGTAEWALHRCTEVVAGLAAHGHDLDAWLAGAGITLTWRGADAA
jgi:predicted RNA-binding protein associated with RNAse of E/G family